jgi:large subunit ribosomal protein L29
MMAEEDIRNFSTGEIQVRLNDAREELMRLRFQLSTGELTDYTRLRFTRRKIARMLTILREQQLAASTEAEQ